MRLHDLIQCSNQQVNDLLPLLHNKAVAIPSNPSPEPVKLTRTQRENVLCKKDNKQIKKYLQIN